MAHIAKVPRVTWNAKNGVWIGAYKDVNGKSKRKWLSAKLYPRTKPLDAQGAFLDFLRKQGLAKDAPPVKVGENGKVELTLAFLAPRWLALKEANPGATRENTFNGYRWAVNNWILDNPERAHYSIAGFSVETELTVQDMRQWLFSLQRANLSDASIRQQINTLRRLFRDCIAEEWLPEDFVSPLDRPAARQTVREMMRAASIRQEDRHIAYLTEEMIETFFSKPLVSERYGAIGNSRRVRNFADYCFGTRDKESCALLWSDVHLDTPIPYVRIERQLDQLGCLPFVRYEEEARKGRSRKEMAELPNAIVAKPKYNSVRSMPIHPLLVQVLRWWKAEGWSKHTGEAVAENLPVFPRGRGWVPLQPGQSVTDMIAPDSAEVFRRDLKRLGLPQAQNGTRYRYHDLRHTFSTLLRGRGVSLEDIRALLGHTNPSARTVQRHYVGDGDETLRADLERVVRLPVPSCVTLSTTTIRAA